LADVAEALGVSKATISLAINGSKEVSEKTREKVIRKIDEMGYVYNRGAAGLSTGENRTVGLAVHDINNPYFTKVCASIEEVLSLNGRMSFLCNTDESLERQQRFIGALVEHNADGLILCPTTGTCVDDLRPLIKRRFPIVLMAHDLEGSELDFVGNDDMLASKLATEHLIGLGHRRIAMIGGSRLSAGRLRRAGCLAAMEDAGLEVDQDLLVSCPNSPDGGSKAVKAVMSRSQPPTGIVCWTDLVALGAFSGLVELGLKPGKDIALIGCDGIAEGERAYVRLSTVNVQKTAIGRTAAEMLVRRLGDPDIPPQRVITKPSLVIRDTCCPGPASGN
jgi:LacI family transcriptional regulator